MASTERSMSYPSPEAVLSHPTLARIEKIELLRQWEYDAAEQEVATEEGMPGGNGSMLQRVTIALASLIGPDAVLASAPTKQRPSLRRDGDDE